MWLVWEIGRLDGATGREANRCQSFARHMPVRQSPPPMPKGHRERCASMQCVQTIRPKHPHAPQATPINSNISTLTTSYLAEHSQAGYVLSVLVAVFVAWTTFEASMIAKSAYAFCRGEGVRVMSYACTSLRVARAFLP